MTSSPRSSRLDPPLRLRCAQGTWTLLVGDLERVDRDLYRPVARTIQGSEAILGYLNRSSTEPGLREATLQLLELGRNQAGFYEWSGGEWSSIGSSGTFEAAEPDAASSAALLMELRAELLILAGSHRALKERVAEVERRVSVPGGAIAEPAASAEPARTPNPAEDTDSSQ